MKRGIALIICLFAMTTRAHLTHAADASPHEDELASVKRKADHSDDLDQKKKGAAQKAAYYEAKKEKIAALAVGNRATLSSLQDRIDKEQDQPGADVIPFLVRYNIAYTEQQMNPATSGAVNAAEILLSLVKEVKSEQAALRQGEDDSEEVGAANFSPRTPYQALEDLLSGSDESSVEDDE